MPVAPEEGDGVIGAVGARLTGALVLVEEELEVVGVLEVDELELDVVGPLVLVVGAELVLGVPELAGNVTVGALELEPTG